MVIDTEIMQDSVIANPRAEDDGVWKEVLRHHLKDFLEFFWPEAYEKIDWSIPYEFLEQELMAVEFTDKLDKKSVDKLFKVFLKDNKGEYIYLHFEIQHTKEEVLSERMFIYYYRSYERYGKNIVSLAILADDNKNWRPDRYHEQIWQSEIMRSFKVIKILDYKQKKEDLLKHENIFALVILAQLVAIETKPDQSRRLDKKIELVKLLHKKDWDIHKKKNIYLFLDILLKLNSKYVVEYIKQVKLIEEKHSMRLVSTAEQYGFEQGKQWGMQQGVEQGVQQGESTLLTLLIKTRFKDVSEMEINRIKAADPTLLLQWGRNLMHAETLEDVFRD